MLYSAFGELFIHDIYIRRTLVTWPLPTKP